MEKALKVFSWIAIVIGGLAILSCLGDPDIDAFLGGGLFFTEGLLAILYIDKK